jgi:hypothetical protein
MARSTFHSTALTTTARRCALAELQAGLACRPACSRSQLRSAGIPLAQPDVPAVMRLGGSVVPISFLAARAHENVSVLCAFASKFNVFDIYNRFPTKKKRGVAGGGR